jgi:hypothetical protein
MFTGAVGAANVPGGLPGQGVAVLLGSQQFAGAALLFQPQPLPLMQPPSQAAVQEAAGRISICKSLSSGYRAG